MIRAGGHDFEYAIGTGAAELSKAAILIPIFNSARFGFQKYLEERDHELRFKEGREPLQNSTILTIDLTNKENVGNHQGELVDALWKHRDKNPEKWEVIEEVFGRICEVVQEGTPQPADKPDHQYLRMKTKTYRDKDTLKKRGAALVSALLMCVLDKDHTVFDSDPQAATTIDEMVGKLVSAVDVVQEIKEDATGVKVQLPKIVIVNDRPHARHAGISIIKDADKSKTLVIEQPRRLADSFPSYQGYESILAEEAVTKQFLVQLRGKKVALFAAKGGEAIVSSFKAYIEKYAIDQKISEAPTFINIEEGELAKSLESQKPDVILLMGEKDSSVTEAADDIVQFQSSMINTRENYPLIPILTFLEGHTSDATVKRISDYIAGPAKNDNMEISTVYLHDILASEVAERLYTLALAYKQRVTPTTA